MGQVEAETRALYARVKSKAEGGEGKVQEV